MRKRKGQIQQVFIYLIVIIAVGFILLVGYRAIENLMQKGCDVQKITFKNNLESYIEKYTSYGSFHKETLNAPCAYAKVCFVDSDSIGQEILYPDNPIIEYSVKSGIEENIFLVSADVTEPAGYMIEIKTESGGVVCINNTNGKFYINFNGLGRTTIISNGAS